MQRSGVFLNLDRSAQRRVAMEETLRAAGLGWIERQPAVDGRSVPVPPACRLTPAEYGCFLSHLQAVEQASPETFRFVFEDDVECSPQLDMLVGEAQLRALETLDVVLLDCQPDCASTVLAQLWRSLEKHLVDAPAMLAGAARRVKGVDLADAAAVFRWGLQAYVVTPYGQPRLLQVLRDGLAQGPVQPVDLLVGDALRRGALRGAVLVPFLATPRLASHADSTIGGVQGTDTQALASAVRRLLFAGPVADVHPYAEALLAQGRATSPDQALLGRVVAELLAVEARDGALTIGRRT